MLTKAARYPATTCAATVLVAVYVLIQAWGEATDYFWAGLGHPPPLVVTASLMPAAVSRGETWRLVSAMFLHAGIGHLLLDVLALLLTGAAAEWRFGSAKAVFILLLGGTAGDVAAWLDPWSTGGYTLGASGGVMALGGALAAMLIQRQDKADRLAVPITVLTITPLLSLGQPFTSWTQYSGGFAAGLLIAFGLGPRSDWVAPQMLDSPPPADGYRQRFRERIQRVYATPPAYRFSPAALLGAGATLAFGSLLLIGSLPHDLSSAQLYRTAPECSADVPASGHLPCWRTEQRVVEEVYPAGRRGLSWELRLADPVPGSDIESGYQVKIPDPNRAFWELEPGETVTTRIWDGSIVAVTLPDGSVVLSDRDPATSVLSSAGLTPLLMAWAVALIYLGLKRGWYSKRWFKVTKTPGFGWPLAMSPIGAAMIPIAAGSAGFWFGDAVAQWSLPLAVAAGVALASAGGWFWWLGQGAQFKAEAHPGRP